MAQNGTLAGDDELILALAEGATVREAAEQAGISERTAYRRLADPDFRRARIKACGRMLDASSGRLAELASKAVETLEGLMESEQPSVALGAAKAVLALGPRLLESAEQEERLCRLEDQADENTEAEQTPAAEEELIQALAAGASLREAAQQAGLDEQTADGRLADPDFHRVVSRARGRLFDAPMCRLGGLASRAAGVFERLMRNDKPSAARGAAKAILQMGPRLRESTELKERIGRLEDQAGEKTDGKPTAVTAPHCASTVADFVRSRAVAAS